MKIAVIGGGSWGTALAHVLAGKGYVVQLLVRDATVAETITVNKKNPRYLEGLELNASLTATCDAEKALTGCSLILTAVPCQHTRTMLRSIAPYLQRNAILVSASKGVEVGGLKTVSEIVREELGGLSPRYAVLSGPSFAAEVVRGLPTAVVLGCEDRALSEHLRDVFATAYFRTYSSTDVRGVELGGATKNIMAIAAGLSDGLHFGMNARAGLITRGLAEMSRLGEALGAQATTFMGLSGLGDLVLTCTGDLSRNRQVGLALAEGRAIQDTIDSMGMVAEGVKTTEAVYALSLRLGIEMPITQAMYSVLYEKRPPYAAVASLMARTLRDE